MRTHQRPSRLLWLLQETLLGEHTLQDHRPDTKIHVLCHKMLFVFALLFARAALKMGGRSPGDPLGISERADVFKPPKEREFPRAQWMN